MELESLYSEDESRRSKKKRDKKLNSKATAKDNKQKKSKFGRSELIELRKENFNIHFAIHTSKKMMMGALALKDKVYFKTVIRKSDFEEKKTANKQELTSTQKRELLSKSPSKLNEVEKEEYFAQRAKSIVESKFCVKKSTVDSGKANLN